MGRALRRHHMEYIKLRVARYNNCFRKDSRLIGMRARTPKPCSCVMCGNPRKFFGDKTKQELNSILKLKESIQLLNQ